MFPRRKRNAEFPFTRRYLTFDCRGQADGTTPVRLNGRVVEVNPVVPYHAPE